MLPVTICLAAALALSPPKPAPALSYLVRIDPTDLTGFNVTLRLTGPPPSVQLAMAIHPEYNDRFWRYVRNLRAVSKSGRTLAITQERENAWRLSTDGSETIVSYRIELPRENPVNRAAWHSTIRADGAALNSVDTFMYLPEFPRAPLSVTFDVPADWEFAIPLTPSERAVPVTTTGRPARQISFTGDAATVLDAPMMLGHFRTWSFDIAGVAHDVKYWPLPNATPFDTAAFVDGIAKVAREAVSIFGKPPYSRYHFLIQDGAWGALEHANAVTIGMPSAQLAKDSRAYLSEVAHEFFHSWNLVRLYPEGRGKLSDRDTEHATGLWLSEGVTIYYSDVLLVRAGLPEGGKTRRESLAELLEWYFGNPGNARISPELASSRAVDTTGTSGDLSPNYYTQGQLLGTALDIIIRDSTRGRRGLDDFMRSMYARFALRRGFTSEDVERTASSVCGCNLRRFFDDHVRNSRPIDINRYLSSIGLRAVIDTVPAADSAGTRSPDTRVWAYPPRRGGRMRVMIQDPSSAWAKAGLRTGMELIAFNNTPVDSFPDFRRAIRSVKLGDVVPVEILSDGAPRRILVPVTGYDRVRARVEDLPASSPAQRERRSLWLEAMPR